MDFEIDVGDAVNAVCGLAESVYKDIDSWFSKQ